MRWRKDRRQYRLLYFFHGRGVAVLVHAIVKKGAVVPRADMKRATQRKELFRTNPEAFTYRGV